MTHTPNHVPCSAECAAFRAAQKSSPVPLPGHLAGCPALYPAQQEPDALTRLEWLVQNNMRHPGREAALALISEAREEQLRALVWARNEALQEASDEVAAMPEIAARILALKVDAP